MARDKRRNTLRPRTGQDDPNDNVIRVNFPHRRKEHELLPTVTRYLKVHEQLEPVQRRARWGMPDGPHGK